DRRMAKRILLVEDEPGLQLTLSDRLRSEGYAVVAASDGDTGYERATEETFDLIILDIMLPGKNGFDVCRDLRQAGRTQPILMLTARDQVADKVVGLKLGADDYLTKPFENIELLARVEALLRRSVASVTSHSTDFYEFGNVSVNFRKSEVMLSGKPVDFSAREFQLLRYFIENRESLLSRDELLNNVWGYDVTPSTRTVDVHIARLRQKIEANPKYPMHILTVHGMGYKFIG
ncbi:MAG: response regulator transcription factor, partial [Acidobacteriota bacterium]|nr:response regulator transcription factor [Acidobacteriota bacterium]